MDQSSLERIITFSEFLQEAKQAQAHLTFVNTPTEHGDNINAVATINGERKTIGILFWDVKLLQDQGLVDTLDDDDRALGMNITDGMVEDVEQILRFARTELSQFHQS